MQKFIQRRLFNDQHEETPVHKTTLTNIPKATRKQTQQDDHHLQLLAMQGILKLKLSCNDHRNNAISPILP